MRERCAPRLCLAVEHLPPTIDGLTDNRGDIGALSLAKHRGGWFGRIAVGRGAEHSHSRTCASLGPIPIKWFVCRLAAGCLLDEGAEYSIDPVKDWLDRSEVGGQLRRFTDVLLRLEIGGDAGSAKAVDRLLRISNNEEAAVWHDDVLPLGLESVLTPCNANRQLDLNRVSVLELIQ